MPVNAPISYEELLNNYEFKVVKKLLMRQHPWIKDIILKDPEDINKYNVIFLDLIIDPYEFERTTGLRIAWYVANQLNRGIQFNSPYLSTFLQYSTDGDIAREMTKVMEDEIKSIHNSPALPKDLLLPYGRSMLIGAFFTDPNTIVPDDVEPYRSTPPPDSEIIFGKKE